MPYTSTKSTTTVVYTQEDIKELLKKESAARYGGEIHEWDAQLREYTGEAVTIREETINPDVAKHLEKNMLFGGVDEKELAKIHSSEQKE